MYFNLLISLVIYITHFPGYISLIDFMLSFMQQKAVDRPNGELTCTVAYIQSKGYLEVTGKKTVVMQLY